MSVVVRRDASATRTSSTCTPSRRRARGSRCAAAPSGIGREPVEQRLDHHRVDERAANVSSTADAPDREEPAARAPPGGADDEQDEHRTDDAGEQRTRAPGPRPRPRAPGGQPRVEAARADTRANGRVTTPHREAEDQGADQGRPPTTAGAPASLRASAAAPSGVRPRPARRQQRHRERASRRGAARPRRRPPPGRAASAVKTSVGRGGRSVRPGSQSHGTSQTASTARTTEAPPRTAQASRRSVLRRPTPGRRTRCSPRQPATRAGHRGDGPAGRRQRGQLLQVARQARDERRPPSCRARSRNARVDVRRPPRPGRTAAAVARRSARRAGRRRARRSRTTRRRPGCSRRTPPARAGGPAARPAHQGPDLRAQHRRRAAGCRARAT